MFAIGLWELLFLGVLAIGVVVAIGVAFLVGTRVRR